MVVAICGMLAQFAQASSTGPVVGAAGVPAGGGFDPELTCNSCHTDFPLNSGQGGIELSGVPDSYVADCGYTLSFRLSDPDASRWGFQLTAIRSKDFTMAGDFLPLPGDRTTQKTAGGPGGRVYASHGSSGKATAVGERGEHTWRFIWIAPPADAGDVVFFGSGNAANADGNVSGDRIYSSTPRHLAVSKPAVAGAVCPAPPTLSATK